LAAESGMLYAGRKVLWTQKLTGQGTRPHTQEIEVEESIHVGIDKVLEEMNSNEK